MKNEYDSTCEVLAKTKQDYESMCKMKSDLEAQLTAAKTEKDTMAKEFNSFKSDTIAKERFAQLKSLDAVAYLDNDENKVLSLVKSMTEGEFSNIVKVVTAAKAGKPLATDQTQTSLPKSTDQTQTNLTKLTQAEAENAIDEVVVDKDKALANVTASEDNRKPLQDFFRSNFKFAKKSEKSAK